MVATQPRFNATRPIGPPRPTLIVGRNGLVDRPHCVDARDDKSMKKVAVFGNAGGGKSTLSRRLAEITGLPLYVLDIIQFRGGVYRPDAQDGGKLPAEEYMSIHRDILSRDEWIIDGYGSLPTVCERISAADTLIYIDLPIVAHYWGVTKRFAGGLFRNPKGWPENTPVWESTLDSYRVIWRCHRGLTPRYRLRVAEVASSKQVHHLTSRTAKETFLQAAATGVGQPDRVTE
jgi:adenylate kinase family enzyme